MHPRLPNELWDRVLPNLSQTDLVSLSRTCTWFRAVTEPHLYGNIVWIQAEDVPVSETRPRLDLILRSILNRPDLGGLVKSVKIHQQDPEDPPSRAAQCLWHDDASFKRLFTLSEIAAIEKLIETESLRDACKQGQIDLIVTLLLSRLSVSKVDLSGITRREQSLSRKMLRDALSRSLLNLQEVSLCGYDFWDTDRSLLFSEDIAYLFESPTIRLIRMRFTKVDSGIWPGTQPITPALTTLVIEKGFVTDHYLRDILAATPNLKTLDCCLVYDANRNESCDCGTLQLALENIKLSVENLRICINYWVSDDVAMELGQGDYGIIGHVSSLTTFPRIKNLEFPLVALLGYDPEIAPRLPDVLPKTLDTFCIRDDMANFDDFEWSMDEILSKCVECFDSKPSLNSKFIFKHRMLGSAFRVEQKEELLRAAAGEGIGCSIFKYNELEEEEPWYAQFAA